MAKKPTLGQCILAPVLVASLCGVVRADDLRLAAPEDLRDSGFLAYVLPRFKLKHRIAVDPVAEGAKADMALGPGTGQGVEVFADAQGTVYRLHLITDTPETETFRDWLQSAPGKAAITGWPRGGPPVYDTELAAAAAPSAPDLNGDAVLGAKLALVHCARCHVVDARNRMGGIGSTPSFAAMRGRAHWVELFRAYWSHNPHPSFTEVIGVTEPFGDDNVSHVAPVRITLEEIEAIVAFVATLKPLDLGGPLVVE